MGKKRFAASKAATGSMKVVPEICLDNTENTRVGIRSVRYSIQCGVESTKNLYVAFKRV